MVLSEQENALRASYLVANRIAKTKKTFTIGEELILPATKDICRELLGEAAVEKIAHVPLSSDTVTRRVEEIAEDIEAQLFERIKASPWYALQVHESTDIDNKAMLLAYVRYLYQEDMHEDLLCALPLPTNTTGAELFKSLDGYISRQLKWCFCVGICTDGAAAMTGRLSGLTARIKEVAPKKKKSHRWQHISVTRYGSPNWLTCVTFNLLNELNMCLQGKMKTVFKLADKVAAFKAKLELWGRRVNRGIFDMFHTLAGILGETEPEHSFSQLVHDHLSLILKEFERYFPTTKDPRTDARHCELGDNELPEINQKQISNLEAVLFERLHVTDSNTEINSRERTHYR
ncbi:SCAN domain-containing protein 3 [Trichonephila inaurata madagascariensis]|uniref:SCAN domain-containing protein 3 n=1 Tax=Trichonephila inaurata madagascariensis TaxID=2747483 RepID=A0A8X6YPW1_9ARAC|nr:SCAN domain-containing protein 3 [Trichonephila inaurata madagascariensis]